MYHISNSDTKVAIHMLMKLILSMLFIVLKKLASYYSCRCMYVFYCFSLTGMGSQVAVAYAA